MLPYRAVNEVMAESNNVLYKRQTTTVTIRWFIQDCYSSDAKKILNIKLKANHGHNHKLGVTNCYFHELIRSHSTTPECKLISVWIIKKVIKLILF